MKPSLTCILALLLLQTAKAAEPPDRAKLAQAARKVDEIVGHRGSSVDRPENTLASYRRAIEAKATAVEIDVRTTKDGILVSLHDADLERVSNGKGRVGDRTLAELKQLDFGSRFDAKYKDERIATVPEILALCRGKCEVLFDLKETGEAYTERIAAVVREQGEAKRIMLGVRSVDQARALRKLLPVCRQIGLIPEAKDINAFAEAGVETIRLWPKWLEDSTLVPLVRKHKLRLHLGTGKGTPDEVIPLLAFEPESLSSDDPARLRQTLAELAKE
ncbi:MAG: glycerophosphodiester phosphodiesterase family protein [Planctomycetia bacterium]|nr:glycerophosphodiester phosphodiesterase family protein [Planctomycetia bacterium]